VDGLRRGAIHGRSVLRILRSGELPGEGDERPSRRGHSAGRADHAFARTLEQGNGGRRWYCSTKPALSKPWMQSVALNAVSKQSERPSCLPMAALRDPLARARPCPKTLISRRGPCAGSRRAVRCRLCGPCTSAATWRWPTERFWLGGSASCFRPAVAGLTVRGHPTTPRAGPDQQIQCLVSADRSLAASPLEGLPLAPGSLAFSGFPLQAQLASAWAIGSPCWLKAADLASFRDGQALRWLWPVSWRAGLVIDQGCASGEDGRW